MKPLNDKILVKPEQRFKSQILDLSQMEGADTVGYVTAVSDEAKLQGLNVGDKVHFGTVAAESGDEYLKFEEYTEDGVRYLKMSWQDVACIIED